VDEPGQHAHYWDEEDDLEDAPADEEEAGDSHCWRCWWGK
jgi:hypothetical protein